MYYLNSSKNIFFFFFWKPVYQWKISPRIVKTVVRLFNLKYFMCFINVTTIIGLFLIYHCHCLRLYYTGIHVMCTQHTSVNIINVNSKYIIVFLNYLHTCIDVYIYKCVIREEERVFVLTPEIFEKYWLIFLFDLSLILWTLTGVIYGYRKPRP